MKKVLLILLSLCIFTSCAKGADTEENTEIPTLSSEEKYAEALSLIDSMYYDKAFALLKEIEDYPASKELLEKFLVVETESIVRSDNTTYTYTSMSTWQGSVVKEEQIDFDASHTICEYELNDKGVCIKSKMETDGYVTFWDYTYDENDNLIREDGVDEDGTKAVYTYEYDELGNLIKETSLRPAEDVVITYEYDEKGNLICENTQWGFGLYSAMKYEYNSDNLKIKTTYEDQDSSWYYVSEYDENGNILSNTVMENGESEITAFTYYPDNRVKSATTVYPDGSTISSEYTYKRDIIYQIH